MKLAEALLLRADLQKKLASLRDRISRNTIVQEGEKPAEDPNELLKQMVMVCERFKKLVFAINVANLNAQTGKGRSLTEALAERDSVVIEHSIRSAAAASATKPPERYGVKEIRWIKTVSVETLQKSVDDIAMRLRELNVEIQAANWQIEVQDIR
jgi:hypothetical protein